MSFIYFQKGFSGSPFIDVTGTSNANEGPHCHYLIITYDIEPELWQSLQEGDSVKVQARKLEAKFCELRSIYEAIQIVKIVSQVLSLKEGDFVQVWAKEVRAKLLHE